MAKRITLIFLAAAMLASLCGCANILEGDTLSDTPHIDTSVPTGQTEDVVEVSSYEELRALIMQMVREHSGTAVFGMNAFDDGDVAANVERICKSVAMDSAFGEYCVYYINSEVSQIVSHYEAKVTVNYRHSKSQIDSVVTTYSQRYLRSSLLDTLENRSDYIVFLTNMNMVTEDYITNTVRELYIDNPLTIVAPPQASVNTFSGSGEGDRVLEVALDYVYTESLLKSMSYSLDKAVDQIVDTVAEDSDALMLLSLCEKLIGQVDFDIDSAADPDLTEQDIAATAFGALVNRSATSEGFALAYKALCDKLGLDCRVVTGRYNNLPHYWNIVYIDGDFYHVDPAMSDITGIENSFLRSDADIISNYWWDTQDYPACSGPLNYSIITHTEPEEGQNGEQPGEVSGQPGEAPGGEVPGGEPQNGDAD
ncbi:MAG: hypothetical protein J5569_05415 [Oscillospiraceae bacterium]|nr:hypothetical protein [Oscillospiraceae bacterium]